MGNSVCTDNDPMSVINTELSQTRIRLVKRPKRDIVFDRLAGSKPECLLCKTYEATCGFNVCSELTICNRCSIERTPSLCPHCKQIYVEIKQIIHSYLFVPAKKTHSNRHEYYY